METPIMSYENELNLKATELRLGLPGSENGSETRSDSLTLKNNKRTSSEISKECSSSNSCVEDNTPTAPPAKAQIVGWPPVRSNRKNCLQSEKNQTEKGGMYVKVSVDGAPYLRKIDLKVYKSYAELLKALENMFKLTIGRYSDRDGHKGSDYAPTYEDKDGDWMLVGDVPWNMFVSSCKRLRIMKGSEAKGLSC